jgi:inner membrane protein
LGACIGEAFFERGFGKKAMWWGIMAQSIPDIDFIASFWMDIPSALLAHRGFTHSILFSILAIPIFSLIAEKWHRPHNIRLLKWIVFFSAAIFIHIFIDAFNSYGVGWFEPFSHKRISFNTLFVADPFFSFLPFMSALFLIVINAHHRLRGICWKIGLISPFLYLGYSVFNKQIITNKIQSESKTFKEKHIEIFTTPAPFQTWLWYVIIKHDSGSSIGYLSVWKNKHDFKPHYYPLNNSLVEKIDNHESLQKLMRFSQGYYTLESRDSIVIFNDLRFGQVLGWKNPRNPFVFHFDLNHQDNNELLIQRGRAAGWNADEWLDFYKVVFDLPLGRLK